MEYKESRVISIKPITFIQFWLQAFALRLVRLQILNKGLK
jgi:hypothetical protein